MAETTPFPTATLPAHTTDFLLTVARDPEQERTRRTYRSSLVRLQQFAEETQLTRPGVPLKPANLRESFLADYADWLAHQQNGRHGLYRPDSVRLFLTSSVRYVRWLSGRRLLRRGITAEAIEDALEETVGRKKRSLRRRRREADDTVGALLTYYAAQLVETPQDEEHENQRLILLRNQALLQVLYATAGRASEVAQLTRANVAGGDARSVNIIGKRDKERPLILTDTAQAAIRAYLHERGEDEFPGLFIGHGGRKAGQPLIAQSIWRIVNNAAKVVFGTDGKGRQRKRVGPHAFRHLRAQHLSDEGLPITSLQALLGHASIATTRDIYAPRTPPDKLRDEVMTYSRSPEDVAAAGAKQMKHEARVGGSPKAREHSGKTD